MKMIIIAGLAGFLIAAVPGQNLFNDLSNDNGSVAQKWARGLDQAQTQGETFWLGYQIEANIPEGSLIFGDISFFHGTMTTNGLSLEQHLAGETKATRQVMQISSFRQVPPPYANANAHKSPQSLALMFKFQERGGRHVLRDVSAVSMNLPFNNRKATIHWLGKNNPEDSLELVTELYAGASGKIREELIEVVSYHDLPEAITFLDGILSGDGTRKQREEALESLANLSSRLALDLILRAVNEDQSMDVREEAVEALEDYGTTAAMEHLIKIAKSNKSATLRAEAVESLAVFEDDGARETIYGVFEKDRNRDVAEEAFQIIAEDLGDTDLLMAVASGKKRPDMRIEALEMLVELEQDLALDTLKEVIQGKDSLEVRMEAVELLEDISEDLAVDVLIGLTAKGQQPDIRQQAVETLGEFEGERVINILERIATTEHGDLAEEAVDALSDIDNQMALKVLVRLAENHTSEDIRDEALDAVKDRAFQE